MVSLHLSQKRCVLKSQNIKGWAEETYKADFEGEPFSFQVQPAFLLDALKHSFDIGVDPRKIHIESDDIIHVACLIKSRDS